MKSKRYKILFLDNGFGIGGGQRSLLLLLKHLDKTQFSPIVGCLPDSALAAEAHKAEHPVIPLNLPEPHQKTDIHDRFTFGDLIGDLRYIAVIHQLLRVIREKRVNLIHANSLATALIGGVAAKFTGIPIIMHKRYATSYGLLDRMGEKLVDYVILVSKATRWNFASASKQALIYNGVELGVPPASTAEVEAMRFSLNLNREDILVGIVTRITFEKGIHLLIEAMAQLKNRRRIKLIIAGKPYFRKDLDYLERLKSRINELGLANFVIFTGFLTDTRAIMGLLDMLLLPSIIDEACPRMIIEAMAAGKPVITTPLGGSKELVTPETGIFVPAEDVKAMADAIRMLADDRHHSRHMGIAGRAKVEQQFSATKNARSTEMLYSRLLNLSARTKRKIAA